ncbi:MAG TPA: PASTA domain-containing protein, partial [Chloroflexota bacterium]|nr:PASTA domain-containing protein [Chloroflexota bacterium]
HWVAATTQRLVRDPEPLATVSPEVPSTISDAVMRALARDPQARFATVGEFRDALQPRSVGGRNGVPTAVPSTDLPAPVPELVSRPQAPDETGLLAMPVIPVARRGAVSPASVVASLRQSVFPWAVQTVWQRPIGMSRVVVARSQARLRQLLTWSVSRVQRLDPRIQVVAGLALVLGVLLLVPVLYRVANPPRTVVVANLAGRELAAARQAAEQAGVPVRLAAEPSDTVPKGHVVRQDPAGDTPFASDRPLTLFVSSGPAPVRMPDVRQRRLEDARQDLEAVGLSLGTVNEFETSRQPWGAVLTQGAYPGKLVPPGTAVDLTVSVPARVEVPLLVDQTVGDAEAGLQKRGLRLSAVRQEAVPGKRAGTVVAQDPPAGVRLRQGESVSVTIAVPAAG